LRHCAGCLQLFGESGDECPDCGTPTVAGPPPESRDRKRDLDLVSVFRARDPLQAGLIVSVLGASGIRATALASREAGFPEVLPGALGNVLLGGRWGDVLVLEPNKHRAQQVIAEYMAADPSWAECAAGDSAACVE